MSKVVQISIDIEYDDILTSREELYTNTINAISGIQGVSYVLGTETTDMTSEYKKCN